MVLNRRFIPFLITVFFGLFAAAQMPPIPVAIDASDAPHKIIRVHEVLTVKPGPLILYYPKWVPGEHGPGNPIGTLVGLRFTGNGSDIPWKRDMRDVFTFHIEVPAGVSKLEADFQHLEPGANASATEKLVVLEWIQLLLYPAGLNSSQIMYEPSLRLPAGWKFGGPLRVANESLPEVKFQPVSLERFADSPVVAGQYYRNIDLTPPGEPIHHQLDLVADSEAALAAPPSVVQGLTNIVAESGKLFGTRHYREYHFLLTLSDHTPHFGLEHNECNDSRLPERVMLQPDAAREVGSLLGHEFAHSWNGKFRRPKDLTTPEFETPMEDDLLWVYEGGTSYLGDLLATRSGMWTPEDYHQALAEYAADLGPGRPGRTWRPLLDTAVAIAGGFPGGGGGGWTNWKRGADYYPEGELIWLEVAAVMHQRSNGQKSFDDFLKSFYGGPNNGPEVKTYTFEELVQALNAVVPYDWGRFFTERLNSKSPQPPVGGIELGGWKLVFTPERPKEGRQGGHAVKPSEYTIGIKVSGDGNVSDSIWDGPAFRAGVMPGVKLVGVNGRLYTPEILAEAIKNSKNVSEPIELLVVNADYYRACKVDYHGGDRYPHLEREESKPDFIDEMIKPLVK